jgi:hypothetical protein
MRPHEQLFKHPDFPQTRGELTEWIAEQIEEKFAIDIANTGNGYVNDLLFTFYDVLSASQT